MASSSRPAISAKGWHESDAVIHALANFASEAPVNIAKLRALRPSCERYSAGTEVCVPARRPTRISIITSGWAGEMRVLADGRRQIFSVLLPGDPIEPAGPDDDGGRLVVAFTPLDVTDAAILLKSEVSGEALAAALALALQLRRARLLNQVVRLGKLDAYRRVIDLLLELHDRLEKVGLVEGESFRIPLTQENFAETLGLSIVHVNRTLQQLRRQNLIKLSAGSVTLLKLGRLRAIVVAERPTRVRARHEAP